MVSVEKAKNSLIRFLDIVKENNCKTHNLGNASARAYFES